MNNSGNSRPQLKSMATKTFAVIAALISFFSSAAFNLYLSDKSARESEISRHIAAFEATGTDFMSLLQKYAYDLIEKQAASRDDRLHLMNLIAKQNDQIKQLKRVFPSIAEYSNSLETRLHELHKVVEQSGSFGSGKPLFEAVGPMLVARGEYSDHLNQVKPWHKSFFAPI